MTTRSADRAGTGAEGFDDILAGGFPRNRPYLLQGEPGTGKTTLALQFLLEGIARGERVLYITLSETREEIQAVAASHGWTLDSVSLYELSSAESLLDEQNTLFHPDEVELHETTKTLLDEVERVKPSRVVFDSLSELRLLAQSPLRYRRQILALKQFFAGRKCTVLLLDDGTADQSDSQVESIAHGVVVLEQLSPGYGAERRRLRVSKLRGVKFRGGYHDFVISTGGVRAFPRLIASEHHAPFAPDRLTSGVPEIDALLGGGLDRGTATLMVGPAGSGKSALLSQWAVAMANAKERAALFLFDESIGTMLARASALGIDLARRVEEGSVTIQQIDPAELSPGEFVHAIRAAVAAGATFVGIDSLNGYLQAMPEERFLATQMHELLTYLGQQGVTSVLIMAQHGFMGASMAAPVDVSYIADTVVLFRYFEARGAIRKAISVVKKRTGRHENTIRELRIGAKGIEVGEPLAGFQGVLTGVPHYRDPDEPRGADEGER